VLREGEIPMVLTTQEAQVENCTGDPAETVGQSPDPATALLDGESADVSQQDGRQGSVGGGDGSREAAASVQEAADSEGGGGAAARPEAGSRYGQPGRERRRSAFTDVDDEDSGGSRGLAASALGSLQQRISHMLPPVYCRCNIVTLLPCPPASCAPAHA
jgi:hypothetical protein